MVFTGKWLIVIQQYHTACRLIEVDRYYDVKVMLLF